MQLEMFILCESFAFGRGSRSITVWTVIGPFSVVEVPQFPSSVTFTVVASIRFDPQEQGDHKIQIRMVDQDLRDVIEPKSQRIIGMDKVFDIPNDNKSHSQLEVWSSGMLFEKPGDYFFDLKVDEKKIGQLPIHILQTR